MAGFYPDTGGRLRARDLLLRYPGCCNRANPRGALYLALELAQRERPSACQRGAVSAGRHPAVPEGKPAQHAGV